MERESLLLIRQRDLGSLDDGSRRVRESSADRAEVALAVESVGYETTTVTNCQKINQRLAVVRYQRLAVVRLVCIFGVIL